MTPTRRWAALIAATVTLSTAPANAVALAGGTVTTDFATDTGRAVAIQPDGKIVVAGGSGRVFALARYQPNGSLDQGFGQGGRVTTTIPASGLNPTAGAYAVTIQRDGRIVVAGGHLARRGQLVVGLVVVARYHATGALDQSFSGDGIATAGFDQRDPVAQANAVAVQPDGRIVTVGQAGAGSLFALARFSAAGAADPSFDGDGKTTAGFTVEAAFATVLRSDGRMVAVGGSHGDFALARYDSAGGLEAAVTTDFGAADVARASVAQPDGRIIAAGSSGAAFALARYHTDGSLDPTFGRITTDFAGNQDEGNAAALQADGKIVVAGSSGGDFALARYLPNGSLDPSFTG